MLKVGEKPIAGIVVLVYGITVAWALPTRIRPLSCLVKGESEEGGALILMPYIRKPPPILAFPRQTGEGIGLL